MIEQLHKLDEKLSEYEYYRISGTELKALTGKELETLKKRIKSSKNEYREILINVKSALSATSVENIIIAYQETGITMQEIIATHIGHNFQQEYIPLIKYAFQRKNYHTLPTFLQVLANKECELARFYAVISLESQNIELLSRAISVCHQLEIREAMPKLVVIAENHPNKQISFLAKQMIDVMRE